MTTIPNNSKTGVSTIHLNSFILSLLACLIVVSIFYSLSEKTSAVYPTKSLSFYDFMETAGQKKETTPSFQVNEGIISYFMK
ncbi:hypothetical protein [Paenibacillus solani]|uniref:hypothetical protein n=1 Tax=Paenibacillus solani TaxID=1705565 RepID=UPI0013F4C253|nr:hypothetical protein [Paenibacillus solani]